MPARGCSSPRIRTSVIHAHFLRERLRARGRSSSSTTFPYVGALALAALGRSAEAVAGLRQIEPKTGTRLRDFMIAARALLEGNRSESLAAVNRVLASDFSDPEGLFYLTRHLARLKETDAALGVFRRVVSGGFSCYPAMAHDEWLEPLRKKREFKELVETARTRHQQAIDIFDRHRGRVVTCVASGFARTPRTDN